MTESAKNVVALVILAVALVITLRGPLESFPLPLPLPPEPATAEQLWILAIEKPDDRTPAQTNVLGNGTYWDTVRARGHKYERYDKPSPEAERYAPASKFADELVFQDAVSGLVLGVEELPAHVTTADVDTLISKYSPAK
jgi:hypothetical protein